MKAKHSIRIDHDESPSIVDEVVNSTIIFVVGNEKGSINAKNGTSTTITNGSNDEIDEILVKILKKERN